MSPDRVTLAAIERALAARHARREGRELRFLCPAHEDRHPSARWNPANHLWCCDACKAGGGWRDLAVRLGVDLPSAGDLLAEVEAVYDYRDAEGRLRFQVLRKRGKSFACRRPLPGGGWAWNLAGVERVLYRLPEVLAAVRAGGIIFVVEGEKDADRVAALGLTATTNPGGAGKWRPSYSATLRGASAVIVPDRDTAGHRHAEAVAASLAGAAADLRWLALPDLPDKGDVSDWIAVREGQSGTAADIRRELLQLAAAAPPAADLIPLPTLAGPPAATRPALRSCRMSDVQPESVGFLWPPYLPLRKLTLLEGDPGQGKSWVTAAIAACGSVGRGLPGLEGFEPFRSLFFSAEDGMADTLRPRLDALGATLELVYAHDHPLYLDTPEGMAELERELAGRQARLVVIDSVMSFVGARTDVYRPNEVRAVLAPLAKLAEAHGCVILALRHITKSKGAKAIYAGQGSIDFTATARSVLLAGSSPHDAGEHALLHIKSNLSALGPPLGYRVGEGGFSWTGESRLTAADLLAAEVAGEERAAGEEACAFLRELLADRPLPARKVFDEARKAGIGEITLRRAKAREGIVAQKVGFQEGAQWLWSLPATSRRRS
jgi:putative DNA primase/helicase